MSYTVTIGAATLMLGDCIERMRELPDASVDLVLTDVPYSSGATREAGKTAFNKTMTRSTKAGGRERWFGSDCLGTRGFKELLRTCALEWQRVLVSGGFVLSFIDWRMKHDLMDAVEEAAAEHRWMELEGPAYDAVESADLKRSTEIVWNKMVMGMGRQARRQHENIMVFSKGTGRDGFNHRTGSVLSHKPVRLGLHPTEKPVGLLVELIELHCPPGGTVLDPFFGSCSTGHAAVSTGRRFIGVERDRRFHEVGWKRLADLIEERAA
ncbi:DNA-methyltransferase [Azospirillum doebereinerae]|uniref:Methyltransferase n=1 Tax=Azospirillum doebereinerae TaxID=92933 RepID=A0A3S0WIP4_9PROT|nr:site-specific DNA-methyltransferase [Azospirillum doebereinerae]RUQ63998.1 site-specific DNA-methyltransferase [Azospirillum doebereinerae]